MPPLSCRADLFRTAPWPAFSRGGHVACPSLTEDARAGANARQRRRGSRPGQLRPRPGPTAALWLLSLLVGVFSLTELAEGAPAKSLTGRSMPRVAAGTSYAGDGTFSANAVRGQRWVVFLVRVADPSFRGMVSTLNSIHRSADKGGPVVLALTNESPAKVKKAVGELQTKPEFFLAGDRGFAKQHGTGTYPEMIVVSSDNRVKWHGNPADSRYRSHLMDLMSGNKEQPKEPPQAQKKKTRQLPKNYRELVEKAIETQKTPRMVELLRMAMVKDRRPRHPVPGKLWIALERQLEAGEKGVRLRMEKKLYVKARHALTQMKRDFAGFPPAKRLGDLHAELGAIECPQWLATARSQHKNGNVDEAIKNLERILRYYPRDASAAEAKQLKQAWSGG